MEAEEIRTDVFTGAVSNWRAASFCFEGDRVLFSTSDYEYGPSSFPIELLEEKLKEHKAKLEGK